MGSSNTGVFSGESLLSQRQKPKAVEAGDASAHAGSRENYQIRFETQTVGPKTLPTFAYVCTTIYYDHIVYTAVVKAASVDDAVSRVAAAWPDARIHKVVEGRGSFTQEDKDTHATTTVFGVMTETRPKSKTKRLFYYFFPSFFS